MAPPKPTPITSMVAGSGTGTTFLPFLSILSAGRLFLVECRSCGFAAASEMLITAAHDRISMKGGADSIMGRYLHWHAARTCGRASRVNNNNWTLPVFPKRRTVVANYPNYHAETPHIFDACH